MNRLKYSLQDELSLVSPRSLEEAYQLALKVVEKLQRKQSQQEKKRGRGFRGRVQQYSEGQQHHQGEEAGSSSGTANNDREGYQNKGGRSYGRGGSQGRGRGFTEKCYL